MNTRYIDIYIMYILLEIYKLVIKKLLIINYTDNSKCK
jgi:hypothetical protein